MSKTLSIIIPAYNEERTIEILLKKVIDVKLPSGMMKEIIIVNDGSSDQTLEKLNAVSQHPNIKVYSKPNGGKASALKLGFEHATGDIILIQDADLEYDPVQYPQLLQPILEGKTEVLYGSRFLGKIEQMRLINRIANMISNGTMTILWGASITDINTCYKVFTRRAFEDIDILAENFAFETEITIKFLRKGLKILEVPIDYQARTIQEGKKINWRTALEMYWPIVAYRFKRY